MKFFLNFNIKIPKEIEFDKTKFKNYEFEFKTLESASLQQETTLKIYEKSNLNAINLDIKCITTKNTESLFHAYKFSCLHPFEFANMIPDGNYLVQAAKATYSNAITTEHQLLDLKEVRFKIDIQ